MKKKNSFYLIETIKLMDIILSNKAKVGYTGHQREKFSADNKISSIDDRLCGFVRKSIESFLQSVDDPYQLGTTYALDTYRTALFPSRGILS